MPLLAVTPEMKEVCEEIAADVNAFALTGQAAFMLRACRAMEQLGLSILNE